MLPVTQASTPPLAAVGTSLGKRDPMAPLLAPWLRGRRRSLLRRLVNRATRPGALSLAGGLPAAELFPAEKYGELLKELLVDPNAVQYGADSGELKERIVGLMRRRGIEADADRILVTTGAQQALDVAARAFLAPGDRVALERFAYTGFREALAPFEPRFLTLASGLRGGLDVDALERRLALGARPKLLYVIPDGHNPLGVSIPADARARLVALAHEYDFVILEDDPYGLLCCDGEFEPPLAALDAERVVHVGTLSKVLAPAMRLGWAYLPRRLVETFAAVKEIGDLECSKLTMLAAARLLGELDMDRHLELLRGTYRERRDALVETLRERLPSGCAFSRPGGGMFVWVELPAGTDGEALLERTAAEHGIVFVPARAFADPDDRAAPSNAVRLSFSAAPPPVLRKAAARFAACLRQGARGRPRTRRVAGAERRRSSRRQGSDDSQTETRTERRSCR